MKALMEGDLKALKYQEALLLLMKDETLKNALKGKWFYLAGEGMDKGGHFTIDGRGELVGRQGTVSPENTVYVYGGSNPLALGVDSDAGAAQVGRRFDLFAYGVVPLDVAPVVVGVPKDFKLELKAESITAESREAAAPEMAPEVVETVRLSVAAMYEAEKAGKLDQGTAAALLSELLRTHE
jgi:hypothetical protein